MLELSVIIPVYNVEDFLSDCLDSVIKCNLNNMEIILVDDGSTDSSGEICEQYALKDKRITVYHKKNGGLSSARNYGISHAQGEYLGFVDSDDIIDPNMFSSMLDCARKNAADIVACGILYFTDDISKTSVCVQSKNTTISEGKEVLKIFIDPNSMGDFAVNKIYKRELFVGIEYPEERIFEDIFTSYKVFARANKVVCLNENYYYYRLRKASVSHSKNYNPKMIDIVYSTKEQLEFIKKSAPEYLPFAYQKHLDANVLELHHILSNKMLANEKSLVAEIRQNIASLLNENFEITRFKSEAIAIKNGLLYWRYCLQITNIYNALGLHPRLQKVVFFPFKKHILL